MSEKGSTMLAILVAFFAISILLISLITIAGMERKMSTNSLALMQARQAVDGGVAWVCEQTYQELVMGANLTTLPVYPVGASAEPVAIGSDADRAAYKILENGAKLVQQESDSCTYEFCCEGSSRGACQNARVKVTYKITTFYHDEGGDPVFDHRTIDDHGKIVTYSAINNASSL